jgi:hypothetical protein
METFSRKSLIKAFKNQSKGDCQSRLQSIITYGWIISCEEEEPECCYWFKVSKTDFDTLVEEVKREISSMEGEDLAYTFAKASSLYEIGNTKEWDVTSIYDVVLDKYNEVSQNRPEESSVIEKWLKEFSIESKQDCLSGLAIVTCHECCSCGNDPLK